MSDEHPLTIGRYRVESKLGHGAMGVVYKGHDPEIDRPVAIKLVRMDLLESGRREDYLALPYFDHQHRFLIALMRREGVGVSFVPVGHRDRKSVV